MESDYGIVKVTACDVCSKGCKWCEPGLLNDFWRDNRHRPEIAAMDALQLMDHFPEKLKVKQHHSGPQMFMMPFRELATMGWIEREGKHICPKCQ